MISRTLSLWIAQSESWQTFIDFNLPQDAIAKYPFLSRYDDFYISLIGKVYDILDNRDYNSADILSVAKGLEIYSLKNKKENFDGVSHTNNILFAAGLYYLADYSASAFILANIFDANNFESEIEKFILSLLGRKIDTQNAYSITLQKYLESGEKEILSELKNIITSEKEKAFKSNAQSFSVLYLAETLIDKFSTANIWHDLLKENKVEHWQEYVSNALLKKFPVWDFFPSQRTAMEKGIFRPFQTISLQTPTSSGKTAICELLIYNEFRTTPESKILYLAPFRALAAELKHTFGRNLAKLGISSKTIYGGNIPTSGEKELIQNVTLLISTPEKFMAIENSIPDFLKGFSMIICDEGHLLNDSNRGLSYELLLSRLKSNDTSNPKFVFISAIVPNIHQINSWLGGTDDSVVTSNYRATEVEFAFLRPVDNENKSFNLDVNPLKQIPQNYKLNKFLTENEFIFQGKRKERIYPFSSVKVKSVAIALKSLNSGSVALFTPTKGGNSGVTALATEMMMQIKTGLGFPKPVDFVQRGSTIIKDLYDYFSVIFGKHYHLSQLIEFGALYHHGDLPQYVREVIEDAIRTELIKLVICTSTLAEGVNLPIRTIVVNSARRFNPSTKRQDPLNLRDLKNLTGRAGRAGKETKGLIIVVNTNDFEIFEDLISNRNVEDVKGFLYLIISRISAIIEEKRLTLTNAILDSQDQQFRELIDAIDISLIDLLSEEVKVEELGKTILDLIDQTFAKFQSQENEAETLSKLVTLRGESLIPIISSGDFRYLKQSGSTLRNFLEVQVNLDTSNVLWESTNDTTSDDWINFIIDDNVSKLESIKFKLSEFNTINDTNLDFETVKAVIKLWLNGAWFQDISQIFENDIDLTLRFVNSFVGYNIQNCVAGIIRHAELKLEEEKRAISTSVRNFPSCLTYGVKTDIQIFLIEIGFNDRIGIIALSNLIESSNQTFSSIQDLRVYLRESKEVLLPQLEKIIPLISFHKTRDSFNYLSILNMN